MKRACVHACLPPPCVLWHLFICNANCWQAGPEDSHTMPTCAAALHADLRVPVQAFAGIVTVSVGHCHPRVVAAVDAQNHRLQHTTSIYLNNQIAEYAQELTARLPGDLKARSERSHLDMAADL